MTTKETEEQIYEFLREKVATIIGAKRAPTISPDSRVLHDLGIVGDDFVELIAAIDGAFQMDWTGLDFERYVPPEPHLGNWAFYVFYFKHMFGGKNLAYRELRIRDLAEAIRKGRWDHKKPSHVV